MPLNATIRVVAEGEMKGLGDPIDDFPSEGLKLVQGSIDTFEVRLEGGGRQIFLLNFPTPLATP